MAGDSSNGSRKLDQTPTWAVAGVAAVIIIVSIALEKIIHKVGLWFTERHKKALFEALEKVKNELMTLGFISLLLTFGQNFIIQICIPSGLANTMLPCQEEEEDGRRRLLWNERRILSADSKQSNCSDGQSPLISVDGLHQLHILIFFLAFFHLVYSGATMGLGKLKMRRWKQWEQETSSVNYELSSDPSRFRLSHETTFVRVHSSFWARIPVFFYVGCFFQQFFRSVHKSDYFTLRNGFINVHLAPGSKFNFQKYIKRSLEDDFKFVVGVSPFLWASFVLFLLLNVKAGLIIVWCSIVPLIVILAVGTKLQAILTRMALQTTEKHTVVQGIPLVQGNDKYFWFGRPRLVLHCIHFVLFLNAFQIIYSVWILYELKSCFRGHLKIVVLRISLGVAVLILCAYSTLPVYALITQMGSHMKMSVFEEQTAKALKKWRLAVKKKKRASGSDGRLTTTRDNDISLMPLTSPTVRSPGSTLFRFKTISHNSRTINNEDDPEISDFGEDPPSPNSSTTNLILNVDHDNSEIEAGSPDSDDEKDFSFVQSVP